jgi:hypothetical protein
VEGWSFGHRTAEFNHRTDRKSQKKHPIWSDFSFRVFVLLGDRSSLTGSVCYRWHPPIAYSRERRGRCAGSQILRWIWRVFLVLVMLAPWMNRRLSTASGIRCPFGLILGSAMLWVAAVLGASKTCQHNVKSNSQGYGREAYQGSPGRNQLTALEEQWAAGWSPAFVQKRGRKGEIWEWSHYSSRDEFRRGKGKNHRKMVCWWGVIVVTRKSKKNMNSQ